MLVFTVFGVFAVFAVSFRGDVEFDAVQEVSSVRKAMAINFFIFEIILRMNSFTRIWFGQ